MRRRSIPNLLRSGLEDATGPTTDASLLARFAAERDEAAFELLVRRHALLVAGVCGRIIRDLHLAEDATHAVFLILARKAESVRGAHLAGWLFKVARRVAMRARRTAVLRRDRESPLAVDPPAPAANHPVERAELLAALDEEIARLPERFRLPVLLCHLGGATTEDAARTLDCPRGTVLSRLATARERLAVRLARRGFVIPLAGAFADLAMPSTAAVACFVPSAVRHAVSFRTNPAANATAAHHLAHGVLSAMKTTQLFAAAGVAILAAGLVTGLGVVRAKPEPRDAEVALVQPAPKAEPPLATAAKAAKVLSGEEQERLEMLAEKLKAEIAAKERNIRLMLDANKLTPGHTKRQQESLARLDAEIDRLERDILERETRLMIEKKHTVAKPDPIIVEALVANDPRMATLIYEKIKKQKELEAARKRSTEESPTVRELKASLDAAGKQLDEMRNTVLPEVLAIMARNTLQRLDSQLVAEESLAISKAILATLINKRDELQKAQAELGRFNYESMLAELEPQREALKTVEVARLRLMIEGGAAPSRDQTLEAILKELKELRAEVKQLRERK